MTFVNENTWDRVIRILLGLVLGYVAWLYWPGTWAAACAVFAAIILLTGVVGWCPVYAAFGWSTRRHKTA